MALKSPNKLSIRLTNDELARLIRLAETSGGGTPLQPKLSTLVREMALAHPSYLALGGGIAAKPDKRQLALPLKKAKAKAKAKAKRGAR
jgi:hypothetical protein